MMIQYYCPVCENTPTACISVLFPRIPIIVQCTYCWSEVKLVGRKQLAPLNAKDVLKEAEMILAGNK